MVRVRFLEKKIVKVKNYDDIRAFDGKHINVIPGKVVVVCNKRTKQC